MNADTLRTHILSSAIKLDIDIVSTTRIPNNPVIHVRFWTLEDRWRFERLLPLQRYISVSSYDDDLDPSTGNRLPSEPVLMLAWTRPALLLKLKVENRRLFRRSLAA